MSLACVFVDGENFRYSLRGLFKAEMASGIYLPKADWTAFFDWLAKECQAERLRTYWYVTRHYDFWPYDLPRFQATPDSREYAQDLNLADRLLKRHFRERVAGQNDEERAEEYRKITKLLRERRAKAQRRFDGFRTVQDAISRDQDAVEFRRAGGIRYNLCNEEFGKEKAVDVKLACDLVELRGIFDVAVIVSGDQDYVPAVEIAKDAGKRVVNVAFKTDKGKLLPGGARRLNNKTDAVIEVDHATLARFMNFGERELRTGSEGATGADT